MTLDPARPEETRVAGELLAGNAIPAIDFAGDDARVAERVAMAAAELLRKRAGEHAGWVAPSDGVWPTAQRALVAFAQQTQGDHRCLAEALFEACRGERVRNGAFLLDQETLQWFLDCIPELVENAVQLSDGHARRDPAAALMQALWQLPGDEGAMWLLRMLPQRDWSVVSLYQQMRSGQTRETPEGPVTTLRQWGPEDWNARLDALSDAGLTPRPGLLTHIAANRVPPPVEAARAQVRLACTYATGPEDHLAVGIGEHFQTYCTGDPDQDASLFWWDASPEQVPVLCAIVNGAGYTKNAPALIAAALAAGLLDDQTAAVVSETMGKSEASTLEWVLDAISEVGVVRLPDGRLTGGDPWWAPDEPDWVIGLEPGTYPVRTVVARHPALGRANAAAELIVSPTPPTRWHLVQPTSIDARGYIAGVGVASFAPARTLAPSPNEALPDDFTEPASAAEISAEDGESSMVMFTVAPQAQECVTWKGLDASGSVVRVVTDLGLFDLDPPASGVPWS